MQPINRVSVISTGTVRIRPQHAETDGTPPLWWINTSRRWTDPLPINVFVIEHNDGLVLFDTGQDGHSAAPGGVAGYLYQRATRFDVPAEATLTEQLHVNGYNIADVRVAMISHLHQDHIGGLRELPESTRILVSVTELAAADRRFAVLDGLVREQIHVPGVSFTPVTPQRAHDPAIAPFTHAHDVMGDGSLLLLPTPGHTPGSMSLLLRGKGKPPMLFVGDLTYDARLLAADRVPGAGNRAELLESTRRVNELVMRHPGMPILAAHDPAAATILAAAMPGQGTTII